MSIERYVELIPQTTDAVPVVLPLERGPGNFLLFQLSSASVNVTLLGEGVREVFAGIVGGLYVKRVKPWKNLRIEGAVGTQVNYFIGNENVDRDETDIRLQTTLIAGITATADAPAATLNDTPTVAVPNTALTPVVPANLSRRRVGISFVSNAAIGAGTVFFRKAGGVNNLLEVQAGVQYNFSGTYGVSVRNDSGGALTAMVAEEQ